MGLWRGLSCSLSPKGASFLHRSAGLVGRRPGSRFPAGAPWMRVAPFLGHTATTFPVSRLDLVKHLITHARASAAPGLGARGPSWPCCGGWCQGPHCLTRTGLPEPSPLLLVLPVPLTT